MKALLLLFLSLTLVCAADKPTVDVYHISQRDTKTGTFPWPEVILEIANPTDKIFYLDGQTLESPAHDIEALRGDRWLRIPAFVCGTGMARRPLKPGARMLVTVQFPWQEKAARFRFYFYSTQDWNTGEVISVRSRGIEKKELGDLTGTIGELDSDAELEKPVSDEELNKTPAPSPLDKDPFGRPPGSGSPFDDTPRPPSGK